jgi:hypothetical protein
MVVAVVPPQMVTPQVQLQVVLVVEGEQEIVLLTLVQPQIKGLLQAGLIEDLAEAQQVQARVLVVVEVVLVVLVGIKVVRVRLRQVVLEVLDMITLLYLEQLLVRAVGLQEAVVVEHIEEIIPYLHTKHPEVMEVVVMVFSQMKVLTVEVTHIPHPEQVLQTILVEVVEVPQKM